MNQYDYHSTVARIGKTKVSSLMPALKYVAKEWKLNLSRSSDMGVAIRTLIDHDMRIAEMWKVGMVIYN